MDSTPKHAVLKMSRPALRRLAAKKPIIAKKTNRIPMKPITWCRVQGSGFRVKGLGFRV